MPDPLNLLFVTIYVGLGGGETALLTLAEHLDPTRFRPHLLVPREGQLTERWRSHGWQVHLTHWRGASTYFIPAIWERFPITRRMERLIREHRIAAVHSDYHSLPFVVPAAQDAGIPSLWTCHGWWFRPRWWQHEFFQRPAAAFAVSKAVRDGFLGDPPFMPPERMPVLPLSVDTERFSPTVDGSSVRTDAKVGDAPLVAMIARFQDVKGHDVFQEMVRLVAHQMPEARFIVAGENVHGVSADDDYKTRILKTAREDPLLCECLVYLGFRSDAERVIAAADVIVCSSHFESYGMVNVEAMASGKPVVSTRRGGPSETIVHGETGFLVDPGDATGLAQHVTALLRDPGLRRRIGVAGRVRAEQRFSAPVITAQFTQTLTQLLDVIK
jgi:glycosyltransferase involved in cell wall biosynthesis